MIPYAQVAAFDDPTDTDLAWNYASQDSHHWMRIAFFKALSKDWTR